MVQCLHGLVISYVVVALVLQNIGQRLSFTYITDLPPPLLREGLSTLILLQPLKFISAGQLWPFISSYNSVDPTILSNAWL